MNKDKTPKARSKKALHAFGKRFKKEVVEPPKRIEGNTDAPEFGTKRTRK